MISYEILEKDQQGKTRSILIDIPRGKTYLSNPTTYVNQSMQKGNTCWYYTMNYLRPRYGKFFSDTNPHRKIEKILSNQRRETTKLDYTLEGLKSIAEQLKPLTKEQAKTALTNLLTRTDVNQAILLYVKKYLIHPENNFLAGTEDYLREKFIKLCRKTLNKLSLDADKTFAEYLAVNNLPAAKNLTPLELETHYANLIITKAAEAYGLIFSSWHPTDAIQSLIDVIQTKGPCYVRGLLGVPAYKNDAHLLPEKFGKRPIYAWFPNEYKTEYSPSEHAILIVGAARGAKKDYVYFIDPNSANNINETGVIYKMSYQRLVSSLSNIYGKEYKPIYHTTGPFALHADANLCQQQKDFYLAYAEFIKRDKLDINDSLRRPVVRALA